MPHSSALTHCVYILHSIQDGKLYTGYTTDLERRLVEHFQGRSKSTKPRRPLILIFCEYYFSAKDAMRREKYFKSTDGKRALRLMLRDTLARQSEIHACTEPDRPGELAPSEDA